MFISDIKSLRMRETKVGGYADHRDSNDQAYIVDQGNHRRTPQARSLLLNAGIGL